VRLKAEDPSREGRKGSCPVTCALLVSGCLSKCSEVYRPQRLWSVSGRQRSIENRLCGKGGSGPGLAGEYAPPLTCPPPPPSPPGQGQWGMGNHTIEGHTHLLKVVRVGGM
jgi:hypothetical protein